MMKEAVEIVKMEPPHLEDAINLVRTSFMPTYLIPSIYMGRGIREYLTQEMENPYSPAYYFVVLYNKKVLGFCELKSYFPTIFLNIIAIDLHEKGKGIGNHLLMYLKEYFAHKNYSTLQLDVFKSNTIANDWYEKKGFKNLSSKILSRVDVDPNDLTEVNFTILNFPQYKLETANYGFSILKVRAGEQVYDFGSIEKRLIIRGQCYASTIAIAGRIIKHTGHTELFAITTSENALEGLQEMDYIIRKELTI